MNKIVLSDRDFDAIVETVNNPPEPNQNLKDLMREEEVCTICSSPAEVGTVCTKYSEELDKVIVDKELFCEKCFNKIKRGQKV